MDGVATYAKLVYANGHYYYINSSLKAVRNQTYFVSYPNGLMAKDYYIFDAQGRMVNPPADALTESISTFALTGPTMSKTYEYVYASGKLMRQILTVTIGNSTTTYAMDFFYDASGMPFAVKYNGDLCYYITNLQGDVMSIVDAAGVEVAGYQYDPYGNIISQSGPLAEVNPLRYRGYVYDTETTLYYLQSRYYDPELGRFINADSYASTGQGILGNNMFAYCLNNPVVLVDGSGNAAHICFGYDGQRDESPWKIGSPGGGGWPQGTHYPQQDYGTVADKFYTVRAAQFVGNQIAHSVHKLWGAYVYSVERNAELGFPQHMAMEQFCQDLFRSPWRTLSFGILTYSNARTYVAIISFALAPTLGTGILAFIDFFIAIYSTTLYMDDIS